jgi:hypothetical protein
MCQSRDRAVGTAGGLAKHRAREKSRQKRYSVDTAYRIAQWNEAGGQASRWTMRSVGAASHGRASRAAGPRDRYRHGSDIGEGARTSTENDSDV